MARKRATRSKTAASAVDEEINNSLNVEVEDDAITNSIKEIDTSIKLARKSGTKSKSEDKSESDKVEVEENKENEKNEPSRPKLVAKNTKANKDKMFTLTSALGLDSPLSKKRTIEEDSPSLVSRAKKSKVEKLVRKPWQKSLGDASTAAALAALSTLSSSDSTSPKETHVNINGTTKQIKPAESLIKAPLKTELAKPPSSSPSKLPPPSSRPKSLSPTKLKSVAPQTSTFSATSIHEITAKFERLRDLKESKAESLLLEFKQAAQVKSEAAEDLIHQLTEENGKASRLSVQNQYLQDQLLTVQEEIAALKAQLDTNTLSLDLTSELSGLEILNVNSDENKIVTYQCQQSGRNGTFRYNLSYASDDSEDVTFTPLISPGDPLIELLPGYFTEPLFFTRDAAPQFFWKISQALHKK